MNFHVLTLFPDMIRDGMNTSIIGRAMAGGFLDIEAVNNRDYAFNKHQKVDDYPYGGGAGMLMQAEPVYLAYESLEEIVTDYVSIGDYVLTGGELPAMVMMDSISRMVPGVLTNQESGETESFSGSLLEYPQYSRPETWHEKKVPPVLLSGHHANVEAWRREQSIYRTARWRPDLLKKADLSNKEWNQIRQWRKQWKEESQKAEDKE